MISIQFMPTSNDDHDLFSSTFAIFVLNEK